MLPKFYKAKSFCFTVVSAYDLRIVFQQENGENKSQTVNIKQQNGQIIKQTENHFWDIFFYFTNGYIRYEHRQNRYILPASVKNVHLHTHIVSLNAWCGHALWRLNGAPLCVVLIHRITLLFTGSSLVKSHLHFHVWCVSVLVNDYETETKVYSTLFLLGKCICSSCSWL